MVKIIDSKPLDPRHTAWLPHWVGNDEHTGAAIFDHYPMTVGLDAGDDGRIIAIIVERGHNGERDVWSVLDWITSETYWETAQNFATDGAAIIILDSDDLTDNENRLLNVMFKAVDLHNDCFGLSI